jgi:[FeFe] hydrogenase H-cluster maturation GTPase HydF
MANLNDAPSADRVHIAFFGVRNAGKSSLVNAVTGQALSVVSDVKGTTTDPVKKAMELLPLGPVLVIDTPGFDDDDPELGEKRVKKVEEVLEISDIAVLVTTVNERRIDIESEFIKRFTDRKIPYIIVFNKCDLNENKAEFENTPNTVYVSAKNGIGIEKLKKRIGALIPPDDERIKLVADLIKPKDVVLLITPIDTGAPKGRMILPQQQVIRDVLEANAVCVTVRETEITDAIAALSQKPVIAITDSQAFFTADKLVPSDIKLTSFSMLFARYNGVLSDSLKGVKALDDIKPGDRILISEGCTHHRQCDDIGTVKLPRLIKKYTGTDDINFEFTSGQGFPNREELRRFKLCLHCGGCMLRKKAVINRMNLCESAGVAFTNYGVALAQINGILDRAAEVFI